MTTTNNNKAPYYGETISKNHTLKTHVIAVAKAGKLNVWKPEYAVNGGLALMEEVPILKDEFRGKEVQLRQWLANNKRYWKSSYDAAIAAAQEPTLVSPMPKAVPTKKDSPDSLASDDTDDTETKLALLEIKKKTIVKKAELAAKTEKKMTDLHLAAQPMLKRSNELVEETAQVVRASGLKSIELGERGLALMAEGLAAGRTQVATGHEQIGKADELAKLYKDGADQHAAMIHNRTAAVKEHVAAEAEMIEIDDKIDSVTAMSAMKKKKAAKKSVVLVAGEEKETKKVDKPVASSGGLFGTIGGTARRAVKMVMGGGEAETGGGAETENVPPPQTPPDRKIGSTNKKTTGVMTRSAKKKLNLKNDE